MANDFLVEHARANVWCVPDQDYQSVFAPALLSSELGSRRQAQVEWQAVTLPNQTDTFFVYQIGNLRPGLIGLFPQVGQWISAMQHCNLQGMLIDLYTNQGVQIPRFETFFSSLYDGNLIIAVKQQDQVDLSKEALYVRFYSNAYFESARSQGQGAAQADNLPVDATTGSGRSSSVGDVIVEGRRITDRQQLLAMQGRLSTYNASGLGRAWGYYNGVWVNNFDPAYFTATRVKRGDWAELVYDTSVRKVVDFPIADLPTFDSKLDQVRKYLLHRYEEVVGEIEYRDDIDLVLCRTVQGSHREGLYYHRNRNTALRMVTHQDYSVPVAFVAGYRGAIAGMDNPQEWTLRLHIREAGFKRPLVLESQRIHELYKLKPEDRRKALLGVDSSLSAWRADNLENSLYPAIMRAERETDITLAMVEQAYGYNAISSLVAPSPLATTVVGGNPQVKLPRGFWDRATIYEYDLQGRLLGWYASTGNVLWVCVNKTCAFVEGRVGIGGSYLNTTYGENLKLDPNYDYAYFKCPYVDGKPNLKWEPAEEGVDYNIVQGTAFWNIDRKDWYTAIRSNSHFLTYGIDLDNADGLMVFSFQANEDSPYEPPNAALILPCFSYTVVLNGKTLIENLDYFINWPQVVICNKEYLSAAKYQRVVIIANGLPRPDGEGGFLRQGYTDVGWVQYGQISRNKRYDLRDDKVQRTVVRGGVRLPSNLSYPESSTGVAVLNVKDGDPYSVAEVLVPIARYTSSGSLELRAAAEARDKEVADYLTPRLPQSKDVNPIAISGLYELYSPFFAKLLHDLQDGKLAPAKLEKQYTNGELREYVKDYLYLLDFEPTKKNLDGRFVAVHPHEKYYVIPVSVYHYYFLQRVNSLFLENKVNLSHFISILNNTVPIAAS